MKINYGILINGLKAAWDRIAKNRSEEMARFDRAFAALYKAVIETRIILGKQKRQPITSEDKEKLSRLWGDAGMYVSEFDHELAMRCDIKSGFWADPEHWTNEQIDDANIRIVAMEREMRELLRGNRKAKRQNRTDGK